MSTPLPRTGAPNLDVQTLRGGPWCLGDQQPRALQMLVFYRGLHCPICRVQLSELQRKLDALNERGVAVLALSMDDEERAQRTAEEWRLDRLDLGYGLDEATARTWGLYISEGIGTTSIGVEEPERFSEPGLFLLKPDKSVYYASIQSMPFARPPLDDLIKAIDFTTAKNYPARGEVAA